MADNKTIFVPDASVLIKWVLDESEDKKQALQLQRDFLKQTIDCLVPSHCFFEIANILGRHRQDVGLSFLSYLMVAEITECPLTIDGGSLAFGLMKKYKEISFYDAAYHALAIKEGATFITADEKYVRKTQKEGHILLLKNYPIPL